MRPVTDALRVERSGPDGSIARVTLIRPQRRNAIDASLIAELRATFASLERASPTELRAVVLAGDGETFCAGADIDWMRAAMAPPRVFAARRAANCSATRDSELSSMTTR
jgi:methylglutaconyl-CoA hydratase